MDSDIWKLIKLEIILIAAGCLRHWLGKYSRKEKSECRLNKHEIAREDIHISRFITATVILNTVYTVYAMYMTHQIYGVPVQIMGCGLFMISVIPIAISRAACIFRPQKKAANILNAIFLQENLSPRKTKLVFALISLLGLFLYVLAWFDLTARGGTLRFFYLFPVCM